MADPKVYTWPVPGANTIALLQTYGAAATLILNGTLNGSQPNNYVNFGGYSRLITLTSVNNLSAINITITGTLNGVAQTETLAGPNANTVASTKNFSTITSITTNGAITAMSVGTGTTGFTNWFTFDEHTSVANLAVAVNVTGTINYSFQVTLDDVQTNATPLCFTPVTTLTGASTDILGNYTAPFLYGRILVNSSGADGTLIATFVQQGLHS
jgi:hypothetical protein